MTTERRIGIPIPTTGDLAYNRRSWPMYAAAVRHADGEPVAVSLDLPDQELAALARSCQGIVLPGSPADVDPVSYGQVPAAECAGADAARERADRRLLEECYRTGKPVLGICFGLQSMNVWRGGTLIQDLHPTPVNHAAGANVAIAHTVLIPDTTLLSKMLGDDAGGAARGELLLSVNSSHHQAVDRVGEGLRVSALSRQDGVVEALEGTGSKGSPAFVLGVQWHPERSTAISATSRAIFSALMAAVALRETAGAVLTRR